MLTCLVYGCAPHHKATSGKTVHGPTDEHNSRSSTDWEGSYYAIMPCADCAGIETVIRLGKNNVYQLSQKYQGRDSAVYTTSGSFTWTDDGNKIRLDKQNDNRLLQVGENQLWWLDQDGNKISGTLAGQYHFIKQEDNGIKEKYWKLISLEGEPVKTTGIREAFIILKQDGNRLTGHGGCNALNGSYMLTGAGSIRFTDIRSSEMACKALQTEQQLITALQSTGSFLVKQDTLFLYKANRMPLARFEAVYLQ